MTRAQKIRECRALHQLEDDRGRPVGPFESIDRSDIGMVQCGEQFRLALKSGETFRICGEGFR
jgi:hypothetical protein